MNIFLCIHPSFKQKKSIDTWIQAIWFKINTLTNRHKILYSHLTMKWNTSYEGYINTRVTMAGRNFLSLKVMYLEKGDFIRSLTFCFWSPQAFSKQWFDQSKTLALSIWTEMVLQLFLIHGGASFQWLRWGSSSTAAEQTQFRFFRLLSNVACCFTKKRLSELLCRQNVQIYRHSIYTHRADTQVLLI